MKIYLSNSGTGGWKGSATRDIPKHSILRNGVSKLASMGANVRMTFKYDTTLLEDLK